MKYIWYVIMYFTNYKTFDRDLQGMRRVDENVKETGRQSNCQ